MPWKVTDVMQERIRFVSEVLRGQENMSELCHRLPPARDPVEIASGAPKGRQGIAQGEALGRIERQIRAL